MKKMQIIPEVIPITQLKQAGVRLFQKKAIQGVVEEVADVAKYFWERGWAEKNAGNISVNVTGMVSPSVLSRLPSFPFQPLPKAFPALEKSVFLVTVTGSRMRDLAKNPSESLCFAYISESGSAYHIISASEDPVEIKPTSELVTHLSIHQMLIQKGRPEKAIVHTHATELIALTQFPWLKSAATLNKILFGMHPETVTYLPEGAGFIPFSLPGTDQIAQASVKALSSCRVVLWEKHGCIAIGPSVSEAFDNIDLVVKPVKTWFLCKSAGMEPEGLTEDQIAAIRAEYNL
jgi:rhamnulose-1-phosphate aldolase